MKLLVVEDNPKILSFLTKGLSEEGFQLDSAQDGDDAFIKALNGGYDVLVLDVLLPGMDGMRLTAELRKRNVQTPILLLTALGQLEDKVKGLEAGADDYLPKPFAFAELIARIRALGRRSSARMDSALFIYNDLVLNNATHSVTRANKTIDLTAREYALLLLFLQNPERLITRTSILEQIWDMNFDPGTNILDVHISHLRKKIDADSDIKLIHTVHGFGYMLKAISKSDN